MMEEVKRNEVISNLINEASDNVLDAVMYVNQVYTDSLKSSGNCFFHGCGGKNRK